MDQKYEKKQQYINFPLFFLQRNHNDIAQMCYEVFCWRFYKLTEASNIETAKIISESFPGYQWPKNIIDMRENGCRLAKIIPIKFPTAGIRTQILYEFMVIPKDENETDLFLLYIALKSVIGSFLYTRTNYELLVHRMAGYTSVSKENVIPDRLKKYYAVRYQAEKIRNKLINFWNLQIYNPKPLHGFYVSFKISSDQIRDAIEKKINK